MMKLTATAIALALAFGTVGAQAQDFPDKPVRMLIPVPAGGALGSFAQALAVEFEERTGQPMVVEPKPGANQSVMMQECKNAAADGYTVCMTSRTSVSFNPIVYSNLQYDPYTDFEPVTGLFHANHFLIAQGSLGIGSMEEMVEYSKANPDSVNFGSLGAGGDSHVVVEWIKNETGADITHVPYPGAAPALAAFAAGEIQMIFLLMGNPALMDQIAAGDVVALAVSGSERHPSLPDTPTLVEVGLNEQIAAPRGWFGLAVPAGTPDDRIAKLNEVVTNILADEEFINGFMTPNAFDPAPMSIEEFTAFMQDDIEPAKAMVDISGVKLD